MSRIDRPASLSTGPLRKDSAGLGVGQTGPLAPKPARDAIAISVDARVRLGKDNKPEIVLDGVAVDGAEVTAQAEVEKNMQGRRAGVRAQVTKQVVQAIAEQVAKAIVPTLEQELSSALAAEHLPASMASDLARQAVPEIAKVVAAKIAEQVKVSYTLGR